MEQGARRRPHRTCSLLLVTGRDEPVPYDVIARRAASKLTSAEPKAAGLPV